MLRNGTPSARSGVAPPMRPPSCRETIKARSVVDDNGYFFDSAGESNTGRKIQVRGVFGADDLQKHHALRGIKEMQTDHARGVGKYGSHFGNGQGRGVGAEIGVRAANLLQTGPDVLFDLHVLHDRLDHQVHVLEVIERSCGGEAVSHKTVQVRFRHFFLFNGICKGLFDCRQSFLKSVDVDFP